MANGESYEQFVEKFKPKKTTDDCYTPAEVYEAVLGYCVDRWGVEPANVVRPFWPGGDYEHFEYPENCVVVDNPPFSILAKIQDFYLTRNIKFFLFAPLLTMLSGKRERTLAVDHIVSGEGSITYENGAVVKTGFVTNLETRIVLETAPGLGARLAAAKPKRKGKNTRRKLKYPAAITTGAQMETIAHRGVAFTVPREDCYSVKKLDAAKGRIYGGGLLLSERAAAKRAAAERAAAEVEEVEEVEECELSPRELELQRSLGQRG